MAIEGGSTAEERINNKLNLLKQLKVQGIWLVDASIIGINVLDKEARIEVILRCWERSNRNLFAERPNLRKVIVIGSTVRDALAEKLKDMGLKSESVPQPQAHIKDGYWPYYRKFYRICKRAVSAES